jgi:hypothetical protein
MVGMTRATPATSGSLAVSCRSRSLSEVVSISGAGRSSGAGVSTERVASKVKSAGEGPERVVSPREVLRLRSRRIVYFCMAMLLVLRL